MVNRVAHLKVKREVLEQVKEFVETLYGSFNENVVSEVLLDVDEFCVGPLDAEVKKIEGSIVTEPNRKKDVKAKQKKTRTNSKKKRA
jgi:hypothetical protein